MEPTPTRKVRKCSFPYFDYDGGNAYLFFCPVEHTSWSIAIAVPSALINAVGIVVGIALLLMIGLALLVVRFVGKFVAKRATRPLGLLAASMPPCPN